MEFVPRNVDTQQALARMAGDNLLHELGIEMPDLVDAALSIRGQRQRLGVRIPSAMPGSHAAGMMALEEGLAGKYVLRSRRWFSTLEQRDGDARIVVAAGTEETGLIDAVDLPVNSVAKGPMMEMAVRDSGGVVSGYTRLLSAQFEKPLFVFLYYVPPNGGTIQAEFSRPTGIRDGYFVGWQYPRIIVDASVSRDDKSAKDESDGGVQWTDEPKIDIEEKTTQ